MAIEEGTTFLFSVVDCKIYPLLSDPAPPGTPTYDTGLDVPGVQSVTATFNTSEKKLRGDGTTLDIRDTIEDVELAVEHALLSHDLLSVLLGGTSAVTGVTPERISEWALQEGDAPSYFKLAFQVTAVQDEAADFHFIAYKCKVTGSPELGATMDDYRTASFNCRAIPCRSDGSWIETSINETAYPLE
jgi:hypothetical protein